MKHENSGACRPEVDFENAHVFRPDLALRKINSTFTPEARMVLSEGDSLQILRKCPDGCAKLISSSPPYNIGKEYEQQTRLENYLNGLKPILAELMRVLSPTGSLCWQ